MDAIAIPRFLHDLFGERQSPAGLAATLAIGLAVPIALIAFDSALFAVAPWRAVLAFLLLVDIAGGSVGNFTAGTNTYYAARPGLRWVFLALHVQILVLAWLLAAPLWPAVAVWAVAVGSASAVNAMAGRDGQRLLGAVLLAGGLVVVSLLPGLAPALRAISSLFVVKLVYGFAVDHGAR